MNNIIKQDCIQLLDDFNNIERFFNKSFIITGSNGLIGNYIVNFLHFLNEKLNANVKAYCISKHYPNEIFKEFHYITTDLTINTAFVDEIDKVDYIIHAACYATPSQFLSNKSDTIALNVDVTKKLISLAERFNISMVFLSSGAVYGDPPISELPISEEYPGNSTVFSTRASYIESKKMGEVLCLNSFSKVYSARLGYIYGPGNCKGRAMGEFINQAIIDGKIFIKGFGSELRSYCYVTDAIKMILYLLLNGKDRVYNVDGNSSISIFEVAAMIAKYFNAKLISNCASSGIEGAPKNFQLDNTKICKEFNIINFVPFEDGLIRTMEWNKGEVCGK